MAETQSTILPIKGEKLALSREGRLLLDIPSVSFGAPGVTSIIGHNGAGKSLLLKVLTGLIKPDRGLISWNGKAPKRESYAKLGYMKQNAVMLRRSARANIEFSLKRMGVASSDLKSKAEAVLETAGLSHISHTSARLLSGGEKQRLSLARMLVSEPEIIFLDEPIASLDPVSAETIDQMILHLKSHGMPVILVTHDIDQAKRVSDKIIFLDKGQIKAQQSADEFFSNTENEDVRKFLNRGL